MKQEAQVGETPPYYFTAEDESMENGKRGSISNGNIVWGYELDPQQWLDDIHLNRHKQFVIMTNEDEILIREASDYNAEKGTVLIHSLNPDKNAYPDFVLNTSEMTDVFSITRVDSDR